MGDEGLGRKLGVWGKDRILGEGGKFNAKDYYCLQCYLEGKFVQATSFWPCIDPDIKSYPYCSGCIRKRQYDLLIQLSEREG